MQHMFTIYLITFNLMKENIVLEEQEEPNGFTLEGYPLYIIVATVVIALTIVSYNAFTAFWEAEKANTLLTQQKASSGAKIESLMNEREENKKQWTKEQNEIESSTLIQEKLNARTAKIEEELAKMNITLIK